MVRHQDVWHCKGTSSIPDICMMMPAQQSAGHTNNKVNATKACTKRSSMKLSRNSETADLTTYLSAFFTHLGTPSSLTRHPLVHVVNAEAAVGMSLQSTWSSTHKPIDLHLYKSKLAKLKSGYAPLWLGASHVTDSLLCHTYSKQCLVQSLLWAALFFYSSYTMYQVHCTLLAKWQQHHALLPACVTSMLFRLSNICHINQCDLAANIHNMVCACKAYCSMKCVHV